MCRLSAIMTAMLLLFLFTCPVCADANYSINISSSMEYAVFSLSFTGSVSSLAIVSPEGVTYDQSIGAAYQASEGHIKIGVRYATAGKWKINIVGNPDNGFQIAVTNDQSFGNFAGDSPSGTEPVSTPTPIPIVTPTPVPTLTPTPVATPVPIPTQKPAPTQAPDPTVVPTRPSTPTTETTAEIQSPSTTKTITPSESVTETSVVVPETVTVTLSPAPINATASSPFPTIPPSVTVISELSPGTPETDINNSLDVSSILNLRTLILSPLFLLFIAIAVFFYRKRKYILLRFRHHFAVRRISRETKRKYREELATKSLEKRQEQLKAREALIKAQMERIEQDKIERKTQQEADIALRHATLLSHEKEQEKRAQEKLDFRIEQAKDREAARLSVKAKQIEEKSAKQIARDTKKIEALKRTPIAKPSPIRMSKIAFSLPFLKRKRQPRESRFFLFQPPNDHCSFDDYLCNFSEPLHWSWNEDLVLHKIKSDPNLRLSAGDVIVLSRNEDISAYRVVPTGGLIPCPEFGTHRIAQLLDEEDPSHGFNR